jgi:nicotinate phosphoribosyltransferase
MDRWTIQRSAFSRAHPYEDLFRGSDIADAQSFLLELGEATVNEDEIGFLRSRCPFFSDQYLCFLRDFKFAPDTHLCVEFTSESIKSNEHEDMGQVSITASGKWLDTTLYENVILQTLNEAYFRFCDTDWTLDGQEELAYQKGCLAISQGIRFADFGSRRRRCIDGQEADLRGLIRAQEEYGGVSEGCFLGTSNVHLAHKLGLVPQATMSHEWFMGVGAAVQDYEKATSVALSQYLESFGRWIHHDVSSSEPLE